MLAFVQTDNQLCRMPRGCVCVYERVGMFRGVQFIWRTITSNGPAVVISHTLGHDKIRAVRATAPARAKKYEHKRKKVMSATRRTGANKFHKTRIFIAQT